MVRPVFEMEIVAVKVISPTMLMVASVAIALESAENVDTSTDTSVVALRRRFSVEVCASIPVAS